MSRGLTEKEAEKLLVIASFNKIIRKINSEEIEKEVLDLINTLI
jgi:Fe-S cluster assembly scaffold protein SufB